MVIEAIKTKGSETPDMNLHGWLEEQGGLLPQSTPGLRTTPGSSIPQPGSVAFGTASQIIIIEVKNKTPAMCPPAEPVLDEDREWSLEKLDAYVPARGAPALQYEADVEEYDRPLPDWEF